MTINGPVRRRDHGRGHTYEDADGNRIPGVTTIINNGFPKPELLKWSAEATANYAVDHWDELSQLAPSARLKVLYGARFLDRDAAANRGTEVHKLAAQLVHGTKVNVPDELAGHVDSYIKFLDEWDVQPILVEFLIVSYRFGWCGTGDLVGDLRHPEIPGQRMVWGLDVKTNRTGIFGETAFQDAGYFLGADFVIIDGQEQPLPTIERFGAVHVRADGYSLVPLEVTDQQLKEFRYIQQVAHAKERSRDYVGEALPPPPPLLEEKTA